AYEYVRSIIPLPNPSLIRKWSSSVDCEPGFLQEAFQSLQSEADKTPSKKDCGLIIDAMSIRKQTLWDPKKEQYSGFVNYGPVPPEDPETLASEALVFILVGTRNRWKCPIGYFLADKMNAKTQAQLVRMALEKAADAGLRVWSITAHGTSVNVSTFTQLGCIFGTTYDSMVTMFKHPSRNYNVYVILDPCHMLKLARNALASLGSFYDSDGGEIQWKFFHLPHNLQEDEGLNLGNKFSAQHLQFQKHKMNVRLAAQTLSSSVANAIEFLDVSMKRPQFKNSGPTIKFIRNIDRAFDILNSRCPRAKGHKQPLRPKSKDTWEDYLKSTAEYLLSLVGKQGKNKEQELLSTHRRKTFIVGFVATIKSTINMANEMFSLKENPFAYLLTYKFSQDHMELLFSCIRSKGGWNNNPNSMQLKYALRKMLFTNAVKASKNSNCVDFSEGFSSGIIPILHKRKHRSPLIEEEKPENDSGFTLTEQLLVEQLAERGHSEFMGNILFHISAFIVK
ncbi:THAP domain-containing 9, partial, partial [Paramuricea clavata]